MNKDLILANHTYNEGQIGWFVAGSALNLIAAGKHNFNFRIIKKTLCENRAFFCFGMLKQL
jgi:hypothetical protein